MICRFFGARQTCGRLEKKCVFAFDYPKPMRRPAIGRRSLQCPDDPAIGKCRIICRHISICRRPAAITPCGDDDIAALIFRLKQPACPRPDNRMNPQCPQFFDRNRRRRSADSARNDRNTRLPQLPRPCAKLAMICHFPRIFEMICDFFDAMRIARHQNITPDILAIETDVILLHFSPFRCASKPCQTIAQHPWLRATQLQQPAPRNVNPQFSK